MWQKMRQKMESGFNREVQEYFIFVDYIVYAVCWYLLSCKM